MAAEKNATWKRKCRGTKKILLDLAVQSLKASSINSRGPSGDQKKEQKEKRNQGVSRAGSMGEQKG